jgi:hypothetical protein
MNSVRPLLIAGDAALKVATQRETTEQFCPVRIVWLLNSSQLPTETTLMSGKVLRIFCHKNLSGLKRNTAVGGMLNRQCPVRGSKLPSSNIKLKCRFGFWRYGVQVLLGRLSDLPGKVHGCLRLVLERL